MLNLRQRGSNVYRLITEMTEPGELLSKASAVAGRISESSPVGVRPTKQVVRSNADSSSLEGALQLASRNQVLETRTTYMVKTLDDAFRVEPTLRSPAADRTTI